jgi:hypothetical protein
MSYFIWMKPEEEGLTYNGENETVQYTIYLTKLNESIIDWFNKLFSLKDDHQQYILDTLEVQDVPPSMYNLFEDVEESSFDNVESEDDEDNLDKLKKFLKLKIQNKKRKVIKNLQI